MPVLALSSSFVTIAVIIGVLFLAGFLTAAYIEWKKRRAALQALAEQWGLDFEPGPDRSLDDQFKQFAIFSKGRSRNATNIMRGTMTLAGESRGVIAGDYEYSMHQSGGKTSNIKIIQLSIMLLQTPGLDSPELIIRREGLMDRIKAAIGFDDIDFESVEFSRRFHVSSSDKRFAWDLIDPRMMEFLLGTDGPTIDLEGGWICLVTGRRWKVDQFAPMMNFGERFLSHWPDLVIRGLQTGQYGGKP